MSVVALLPSYTPFHPVGTAAKWEPIEHARPFVRSREATRWHRPRSGVHYLDGHTVLHYWCGQSGGSRTGPPLQVDAVPPGEDACGTCEGRWLAQQETGIRFDPVSALRPRLCPASRRTDLVLVDGPFDCLACGAPTTGRTTWRHAPRVRPHPPGRGLVDPCRWHGWLSLIRDGATVACACTREDR